MTPSSPRDEFELVAALAGRANRLGWTPTIERQVGRGGRRADLVLQGDGLTIVVEAKTSIASLRQIEDGIDQAVAYRSELDVSGAILVAHRLERRALWELEAMGDHLGVSIVSAAFLWGRLARPRAAARSHRWWTEPPQKPDDYPWTGRPPALLNDLIPPHPRSSRRRGGSTKRATSSHLIRTSPPPTGGDGEWEEVRDASQTHTHTPSSARDADEVTT